MEDEYNDLWIENDRPLVTYKIFDPEKGKYCRSGRSLYGRPRTQWGNKASAVSALKAMPKDVQERAIIKKFVLQEAKHQTSDKGI
jgi:hypothetical protein